MRPRKTCLHEEQSTQWTWTASERKWHSLRLEGWVGAEFSMFWLLSPQTTPWPNQSSSLGMVASDSPGSASAPGKSGGYLRAGSPPYFSSMVLRALPRVGFVYYSVNLQEIPLFSLLACSPWEMGVPFCSETHLFEVGQIPDFVAASPLSPIYFSIAEPNLLFKNSLSVSMMLPPPQAFSIF